MSSSEHTYIDLLFRASRKYASWDPEIVMKNGTFLKEGNIFLDGKAKKYDIPDPIEYDGGEPAEGETWIVSQNAEQVDLSASVGGITPAITQCKVKGAFKFSSGRGAILVTEKDKISLIDPPGALRSLLEDLSTCGMVVVSEVHCCSSYARLLTAQAGSTIALGLSVKPPVSGVASATADATWVRNVNTKGDRKFYPLFRLVSITEQTTSTCLRRVDEEDVVPPIPDAEPPWEAADVQKSQKPAKLN
ncbi:hypothetical protein B0H14DRAFT_3085803 [Mycena olivaceomarginata]|nr:hypothetical protein B0H14DRAFT_3085803 [Mycena olivaceomarginata]